MSYHLHKAVKFCLIRNQFGLTSKKYGCHTLVTTFRKASTDSSASITEAVQNVKVDSVSKIAESINEVPAEILNSPEIVQQIIDPPFSELGLGSGWLPYHWIQAGLESMNLNFGLPWWATITAACVIMRACTFPLFVETKRYTVRMSNYGPKSQELMRNLQQATSSTDSMARAKASREYFDYTRQTKTAAWHSYPMFVMGGAFTSCFLALRQIANVPLPSLEASSFLWLNSLTEADPYRMLPLATGCVIGLGIHYSFKFGTAMAIPSGLSSVMKYVPILPVVLLPLLAGNMSAAVQIFMIVNMSITTCGNLAMMNPSVQKKLNIPERIIHQQTDKDGKKKKSGSLREMFNDSLDSRRVAARAKTEARNNRRREKAENKRRAKELKSSTPPITFEIGTQAVLVESKLPDFQTYGKASPEQFLSHEPEDPNPVKYRTITLPDNNRY